MCGSVARLLVIWCEAAIGATLHAMELKNFKKSDDLLQRMERRKGEIVVACILTLAALAYLGVTAFNGVTTGDRTSVSRQSETSMDHTQ